MKKRPTRAPSAAASTTMRDFGPRLRDLREHRRLSQRELASLLDIDYMQVYRYEKGVNIPSAETIVKLAQILQVSTDQLLTGRGDAAATAPKIRNPKLFDRFQAVDELPKEKQEMALQLLDAILSQHALESIADRSRRRSLT